MTFFRQQQQQISLVIVVLLLGGWFAVACQNCFAHTGQDDYPESSKNSHCADSIPYEPVNLTQENHGASCKNACDCEAVVSNIKPLPQNGILEFHELKLVALASPVKKEMTFVDRRTSYPLNTHPPNCLKPSPIDTYCVQIK